MRLGQAISDLRINFLGRLGFGVRGGNIRAREIRYGLFFALPAILFFATFYVYPLVRAVYISFQRWGILGDPEYIGIRNYTRLFTDPEFLNALIVTFYYTFGTVVPIWVLALALALVFNNAFRFRQAYLTVYFIPAIISLTVWCLIWLLMYHPTWGLLTIFTRPLGFQYIRWLNDISMAMPALIILSIWKGTPYYMPILLAGLRSIPADYYEAAEVDGANWVQRLFYITLPLLRPVMLYVAVISIIVAFQVFTPAYLLTQGGPGSATRVLPLFVFQNAFEYLRMGYAAAASMVLLLVLVGVTFIQFRVLGARPD